MIKNLKLNIPVTIFKEGTQFIAYSPVLDLSTHAESFSKVQTRFAEVVNIFFEELTEQGNLDDVLADLGWQKVKKTWTPPVPIAHEMTQVNVALPN